MAKKIKKKAAAKAKPKAKVAEKNKKPAPKAKAVKKAKPAKPAKKAKTVKAIKKAKPVKAKKVVEKKTAKPAKETKPLKAAKPVSKKTPKAEKINPADRPFKILKPGTSGKNTEVPPSFKERSPEEKPRRRRNKPAIAQRPPSPSEGILKREVDVQAIAAYQPPIRNLAKPIAIIPAKKPSMANDPEKTRYNDKELNEFKEIILKKIEDAKKELNNLQAQLINSNDHGTDDTASSFKMLEDGSDTLAKEEAGQLAARQRKFIEQLENALMRIENKTYGICRVTGKLIPKERLRAVPHTTQSIEAKMQQYRD